MGSIGIIFVVDYSAKSKIIFNSAEHISSC